MKKLFIMSEKTANKILVVGIPPKGIEGLSAHLIKRIQGADLLCGAERHLALFPEGGIERWTITSDILGLVERIKSSVEKEVVVLATGDPLLYGIGATLVKHLGAEALDIHPQVSAAQEAFARLGMPWHDARILSAHGRAIEPVVAETKHQSKVAIYTDGTNTPAVIATALFSGGSPNRRVVVAERLGESAEHLTDTTLEEVQSQSFHSLNVMLVLDVIGGRQISQERKGWVTDSELETFRGQYTRQDVRALSLAKLGLRAGGVVWDIGAGSGAISIDIALHYPGTHVFAIERDPEQRRCVQTNVVAYDVGSVRLIEGEAPDVLQDLPDPQAIFIGGSGGKLTSILNECWVRCASGVSIVANVVVLDHLNEFLDWCRRVQVTPDILHVQLSRGKPLIGSFRLEPLTPVYVLAVQKTDAKDSLSDDE